MMGIAGVDGLLNSRFSTFSSQDPFPRRCPESKNVNSTDAIHIGDSVVKVTGLNKRDYRVKESG